MMLGLILLAIQAEDPVEMLARERKKIAGAERILERAPDDPDANALVGRFLCLFSGEWASGLPMLARGKDQDLRAAAVKELAEEAPQTVAEAWWIAAGKQKGTEAKSARAHAAEWFRKAYVKTEDKAEKRKISARLAEFYKGLGPIMLRVPATDAWTDTKVDLVPGMMVQIKTSGTWCLDGNADKTKWCDWKGYPRWFVKESPLATGQVMCLVSRIGEKGRLLASYKDSPFMVDVAGRLFLGPNDSTPQDNQGELAIVLELSM